MYINIFPHGEQVMDTPPKKKLKKRRRDFFLKVIIVIEEDNKNYLNGFFSTFSSLRK
jgi:hypothetical protein